MWREYSWGYIKNNRSSSISVMVAALISALLLSLLCSLFYNLWWYEIVEIESSEGKWHARITGDISVEDLSQIENYANVESVAVNEKLSEKLPENQDLVVDVCFHNMRRTFKDMPQITGLLGIEQERVSYHYALLAMYLVRDPQDPAPRLLFPFVLALVVMSCVSLIMIIHNSFGISMNARIHQFGIFSSIGATPGQIRICLLQEAMALCAVPVVVGNFGGILAAMALMGLVNKVLADVDGRLSAAWVYHPLLFVATIMITFITIWISAWIPARKLSKMTPLEAIKNTGDLQIKRKRKSRTLALLFGMEGELAGNALKAQKKILRTASISLTFSFLAFTLMQCFFTLSAISQEMTYFARYQNAWDIMVTLQDTEIASFVETDELQKFSGIKSAVLYQKASAKRVIEEKEFSGEFSAMGGMEAAPEIYVSSFENGWLVNAPIVIMDDASFADYCIQIGAEAQLDGAVILNRIQDVTNPNFRERNYMPYLNGSSETTLLRQTGQEDITAEIPVTAYTQEVPLLREAYGELDYYGLVHFLPLSVWNKISGQIGGMEENSYIRVLAGDNAALEELSNLEEEISQLIGGKYEMTSENRIKDTETNRQMIKFMMMIWGGFCVLLAVIGIGNVFSNTLGFVRQRKREFARYMSVGLTPEGIRKMFCVEALLIAGRPLLITLPVTVVGVLLMTNASYLDPMIFLKRAPIIPILVFMLAIFAFVALAYYLGGRMVMKNDLAGALREDTLM